MALNCRQTRQWVGTGDPTRALRGVITGIGFLGSGVIFRDTHQPAGAGHTSAAVIMLTAMIGAVCGLGAPVLAVGGTAFALGTLWYARRVERRLNDHWENRDRRRQRRNRHRTGVSVHEFARDRVDRLA
jgi:putative Mg2+ transporter-C (MgtC) family protein